MTKRHLPLIGILISVLLFVVAATYYPGGTLESAELAGYDWTRHYISTLFAATALNGVANPARYFAIPAMLFYSISIAMVFKSVSLKSPSKAVQKTIEIGGIGSMVYAFLAVATVMHDLLVSIALLFFLAAFFATLRMLQAGRQTMLILFGMASLALLAVCAVMYYGNVLMGALPVAQKLAFVVCTAWLLTLQHTNFKPALVFGTTFLLIE